MKNLIDFINESIFDIDPKKADINTIAKYISDCEFSIVEDEIVYKPNNSGYVFLDFKNLKEIPASFKLGGNNLSFDIRCEKLLNLTLVGSVKIETLLISNGTYCAPKLQKIDLSKVGYIEDIDISQCKSLQEIIGPKSQDKIYCSIRKNGKLSKLDLSGVKAFWTMDPGGTVWIENNKMLRDYSKLPKEITCRVSLKNNSDNGPDSLKGIKYTTDDAWVFGGSKPNEWRIYNEEGKEWESILESIEKGKPGYKSGCYSINKSGKITKHN